MKDIKKIVRRLRAREHRQVRLYDMLINIKSANRAPGWTMRQLKGILLDKSLDREYGIKSKVIDKFGSLCFCPDFHQIGVGHRTYEKNGKFFSYNPDVDELPF